MRWLALSLLLAAPAFAQSEENIQAVLERDLREMTALIPGVYTNEEAVYFQTDLDLGTDMPRVEMRITPDGDGFRATSVTENGEGEARLSYSISDGHIRSLETRAGEPDCRRVFHRRFDTFVGKSENDACGGEVMISESGLAYDTGEHTLELNRADPFTCWVAPQKTDGEYAFRNDIVLHDGGGREWIAGEDFETVGLRMRHVRWPSKTNRDSLVLYVHRGEDTDWERAESYAWTEPNADRIALNLRWVQVSCTRGGDIVTPGINLKTGSGN